MSATDLALVESRALRDQHVSRVEVLDKVKALALLPDNTHATTEIVAAYYEVDVETIKKLVQRNREELTANGFRVLRGADLHKFKRMATEGQGVPLSGRVNSLALFDRTAVLNVGQLLTGSDVARQVRSYLLGAETKSRTDVDFARLDINDPNMVMVLAQAAQRSAALAIEERNGRLAAEAQVAELEPKAKTLDAIEAGEGMPLRTYRKSYFPDIAEREFFTHLYRRGFLIDQRGTGPWDPRTQRFRDGAQHGHPAAMANPYLYLHSQLDRHEIRRYHARVRPGQPEIKLRDLLIRQGLTPKLITDADLERTNP
jgi:hypothetical protein